MPVSLFPSSRYLLLFVLLGIAYIVGLFVPLLDSDAAHHANIALHMYQHDDFVNLVDKGNDYLDKPHLLFWVSAISYYIFGVTTFAYKLPSLLFSMAAVYATYKLGKRLYDAETGRLSALILAAAQAFILACMDVRMDAILTACIILAVWQLVESVTVKKWYNLVLAALFMGLGFSTKGLVGIIMPGVAIFFYLLFKRDWKQLFNGKWILLGLLTVIFMLPVIYCFYLQYDLHPEKNIRGMTHISGVKFILWGQNIERLEGKSWGGGRRDYFFYLHTLLWAFLPWSILAYYAAGRRIKELWTSRLGYSSAKEGLTIGTILLIFILISGSRFQLPHYLNILFPYFSILVAAALIGLWREGAIKTVKILNGIQLFIVGLFIVLLSVLCGWLFPANNIFIILLALAVLAYLVISLLRKEAVAAKLVTVSVACMAMANILLSGSFYPSILKYQGGSNLAYDVRDRKIDTAHLHYFYAHSFAFDFYTKRLNPQASMEDIRDNKLPDAWLFTNHPGLDSLRGAGIVFADSIASDQYRLTRLKKTFLVPSTRAATLEKYYLVRLKK